MKGEEVAEFDYSPSACKKTNRMPCPIVQSGRRLIYRLLSWNPWQHVFLRLVERFASRLRC